MDGRVSGSWNWLIQPEGNHVDNQAEVSPDEEDDEPEVLGIVDGGEERHATWSKRRATFVE